jgi:hypothetical protein
VSGSLKTSCWIFNELYLTPNFIQVGSKDYRLKDFRYLKPKRASVTKIYVVTGLEYV